MITLDIETHARTELIDVTRMVADAVGGSGFQKGAVLVFAPHTTAGVTINENADPTVRGDLLGFLNGLVPKDLPFRHTEGNADAHIKASLVGCAVTAPVEDGRLRLGTWQGIYFCEFDGPRQRRLELQPLLGRTS